MLVSSPTTFQPAAALELGLAPYRLSGCVYGVLVNHGPALAALADAVTVAPYNAAPRAPVMYVKPRNTLARSGDCVAVPAGVPELEIGASLGMVIGRTAYRVCTDDALAHVAGYTIVNDICVPHTNFHRPQIHHRVRDGFCPLGPVLTPREDIANPDALRVRVFVDGRCVHVTNTAERIRAAARLLADVSAFMTLRPGDVLMLGVSHGAPLARAGQRVAIEIDGLGRLENNLVEQSL